MLVTNQTIAPYTYYSICENSEMYGYEFILVDQYILYQYLHQNNLNIWSYKKVENIPSNISLSYQICKEIIIESLILICIYFVAIIQVKLLNVN